MKPPTTFPSLPALVAALGDVRPLSVRWHDRHLTTETIHWSVDVASCADLELLAAQWSGKRADKPEWRGTRLLYADVGAEGAVQHVCHTGLTCWGSK